MKEGKREKEINWRNEMWHVEKCKGFETKKIEEAREENRETEISVQKEEEKREKKREMLEESRELE